MPTNTPIRRKFPDGQSWPTFLGGSLAVAAGYALLAWVALKYFSTDGVVTLVWPASGFALAVLALWGPRYVPAVGLGAFLAGALAGTAVSLSAFIAFGNVLAAVLALRLLPKQASDRCFESPRDLAYLLMAGAAGCLFAAVWGVTWYALHAGMSAPQFFAAVVSWWQGDLLGILLVYPLMVTWLQPGAALPALQRYVEFAFFVATLSAVGVVLFLLPKEGLLASYLHDYWAFLLSAWGAVRFGRHGATLGVVLIATLCLVGDGFRVAGHADTQQTELARDWLFLLVLGFTAFMLALVLRQREQVRLEQQSVLQQMQRTRDAMAEGLVVQDAQDRIIEANAAAERILGLSAQQLRGLDSLDPRWRAIREDGSPYDPLEHPSMVAVRECRPVHGEIMGVHKPDGEITWIKINAEPLLSEDGTITGVVTTFSDITVERVAVEALVANAELLAERERFVGIVADNTPGLVAYYAADGRCRYANLAFREWFGDNPQVVPGGSDGDAGSSGRVARALAGEKMAFEHSLAREDGTDAHYWVQYVPDRSTDKVVGFILLATDITPVRLALQDAARLAALVRSTADAVIGLTLDGVIDYWNPAATRLFGYAGGEVIGQDISLLYPPERVQEEAEMLRLMRSGNPMYQYQSIRRRRDGSLVTVALTSSPVMDDRGHVVGISKIVREVTDLTRLQQRQKLLDAAIGVLNDIVMITEAEPIDEPGPRIVFVNEAFERITGYRREDVIGRSPRLLQGVDTDPAERARMRAALEQWQPVRARLKNYRKDGTPFWIELNIVPIADETGWFTHWVAVERDITQLMNEEAKLLELNRSLDERVKERTADLVEAKEMAEAALRARDRFMANISHEIRTPMNSVIGMSQLALRTGLDDRQRDYVNKILASGEHMLGLIDDLLDFAKIEAGMMRLESTQFDLRDWLAQVERMVEGLLVPKGLSLEVVVADDVPAKVVGDPLRLRQMLLNYLNNAAKFSDSGVIRLSITRDTGTAEAHVLRFSVEDNGIGLSPDVRQRLFRIFEQGNDTISRRFGGTGLGLAITRELASMMGGEVGADNVPGSGSLFWFTAILGEGSALAALPRPSVVVDHWAPQLGGMTLLLVEDNPLNQQVAAELLRASGAHVEVAGSGTDAIALSRLIAFQCVLMDLHMPDMDGFEATRGIRSEPRNVDLPVIALTADASQLERARGVGGGLQGYMTKPFKLDELAALIKDVVHARSLPREMVRLPPSTMSNFILRPPARMGIDFSMIARFVPGNHEDHLRYARMFIDLAARRLADAELAIAQANLPAVTSVAHQLKSSARLMGVAAFVTACERLEGCADVATAAALVGELQGMLSPLASSIDRSAGEYEI